MVCLLLMPALIGSRRVRSWWMIRWLHTRSRSRIGVGDGARLQHGGGVAAAGGSQQGSLRLIERTLLLA